MPDHGAEQLEVARVLASLTPEQARLFADQAAEVERLRNHFRMKLDLKAIHEQEVAVFERLGRAEARMAELERVLRRAVACLESHIAHDEACSGVFDAPLGSVDVVKQANAILGLGVGR